MTKPKLIEGDLAIDARGKVFFINNLDLEKMGVKRFYIIENHSKGFVRAWHGHKIEAKIFCAIKGSFLVGVVSMDSNPPNIEKFVLSEDKPSALYIPPENYNGLMALTENAKMLVFSTATLEQSKDDDIRKPARFWNIWNIEEK